MWAWWLVDSSDQLLSPQRRRRSFICVLSRNDLEVVTTALVSCASPWESNGLRREEEFPSFFPLPKGLQGQWPVCSGLEGEWQGTHT